MLQLQDCLKDKSISDKILAKLHQHSLVISRIHNRFQKLDCLSTKHLVVILKMTKARVVRATSLIPEI